MTEEHKKKLVEGRAKARLARKEAQSTEHLAPGKDRNEQRAINKDSLAREQEQYTNETGIEAIDRSKLDRKDNEIQRHLRRRRRDGGIGIEGMQPGKRYALLTLAGPHGEQAKMNIRQMNADAKAVGYKAVEGDNPAGKNLEGNDGMAGTTGRGLGDTYLAEIREEDYQECLAYDEEQKDRQGIIEDKQVVYAQDRLGVNAMHNIQDESDRFMTSRVSADQRSRIVMRSTNATPATEGDFRRGSLKMPDGRTYTPEMAARPYGRRA